MSGSIIWQTVNPHNLLLCLLITFASCSKPDATPPRADSTTPGPKIDACALLTGEEINSIQGAPLQGTTASERPHGGNPVAQCYFALPTGSDSLTLAVYRGAKDSASPRAMWEEMFHQEKPVKMNREGKPKDFPKPVRIEGVGEEAFWTGGQFGGTLHARKGQDVIQLSVGGPGEEEAKLEKLKALAERILARL